MKYLSDTESQLVSRNGDHLVDGLEARYIQLLTAHYVVPQQVCSSIGIVPSCLLTQRGVRGPTGT